MLFRPAPTSPPLAEGRQRALDSPRVLTTAALLLVTVLAGLLWLASRTSEIATPLVSDVLLYALVAVNLALLAALVFVLARSLLKLWFEQRRAAPFARFRAKLVTAMLALTIVPALLVLLSGSEIISNSAARWFSEPVDDVLSAAQVIASRYYQDRRESLALRGRRLVSVLPPADIVAGHVAPLAPAIDDELRTMTDGMVEVYRTVSEPGQPSDVALLYAVESPTLPKDHVRASADQLAARAAATGQQEATLDDLDSGGILVRSAWPVRNADNTVVGAVVVSQHLGGDIKAQAQLAAAAYEKYQGLKVLKGPIQSVYLTIFLTVTLLILISATWMGLTLAKRITRPVQMLAEGARAIGAGQLDLRLEPETGDELGSLVESFNMMAAELGTSRERLEQSRQALERTNLEVEARRRYIETILERVATGVISLDAQGRLSTINGAAERLLGLDARALGHEARVVFGRDDLQPLLPLVDTAADPRRGSAIQEFSLVTPDREVHLAGAATPLVGEGGRPEGAVVVLDDVTPLIRAQRVAAWRDVARRLAHEIKNPLTPIQLSAERLRRHFGSAPPQTVALVRECTDAIITEVEALKGLVDEFAQFARLRGPRLLPVDLNALVTDTLQLYAAVLLQGAVRLETQLSVDVPKVRIDAEQLRQVIINLVDNALEALGGPGMAGRPGATSSAILVTTSYDRRNEVVRLVVSDNGPGVPPADRDKLFMPYYSTKGRGSGLGLAIVRRIVVEHGGTIEVGVVQPTGTSFTIELPAT